MTARRGHISGVFLAAFLFVALASGFAALPSGEGAEARDILCGALQPKLERAFDAALWMTVPAREAIGRAEYALTGQGRRGVVVGTGGWLFTEEEFTCPHQAAGVLEENLRKVEAARRRLASQGSALAVVLVPSKARIFARHLGARRLPGCRAGVYGTVLSRLKGLGVFAPDLQAAFNGREGAWMKTDTHWSPLGARIAALETAAALRGVALPPVLFRTESRESFPHAGDLARFLPGSGIVAEEVPRVQTFPAPEDIAPASGDALLADTQRPRTALVGTSFSAMEAWNFGGFLKEALSADMLVVAKEGLGPFAVMDEYLASGEDLPPLVIWEMPERYFL